MDLLSLHAIDFNFDVTQGTMSGRVQREKRKATNEQKHVVYAHLQKKKCNLGLEI